MSENRCLQHLGHKTTLIDELVRRYLAARPAASRVAKQLLWKAAVGVNLEGLATGPPLAKGGRAVVAIADNGGTNVPTLLVTFRLTNP